MAGVGHAPARAREPGQPSDGHALIASLAASRRSSAAVVVASARSIAQVLSPEPLQPPFVLRRGAEVDRDRFVAGLVDMGYRREHLVEHRAELAVRGGIVDVWPAQGDEPLRLDFFGDEVERLTVFDIATQRSTHDVDEALIAPAREWLPGELTRLRAEELALSAPWASETFDRLATGQLFDGMEGWMGLFIDAPRTFLDEAANATVIAVEPSRVRARLEELLGEERELTDVVAATWRASERRAPPASRLRRSARRPHRRAPRDERGVG